MNHIGNITQKYEHQTLLSEATDKRRIEAQESRQSEAAVSDTTHNDKVSLSQASKEMQLAKNAVAESPDIREEKVMQLKQAIADGRYEMNSEKIADKLVGTLISEII